MINPLSMVLARDDTNRDTGGEFTRGPARTEFFVW
jgi:hypothetical protein